MRKFRARLGIFLPKWEAAADNCSTGGEGLGLRGSRCEEFRQLVQHMGGGAQLAAWERRLAKR